MKRKFSLTKTIRKEKELEHLSKLLEERARDQKFLDATNSELCGYFMDFREGSLEEQQIILNYLRQYPQDILYLLVPIQEIPKDIQKKFLHGE